MRAGSIDQSQGTVEHAVAAAAVEGEEKRRRKRSGRKGRKNLLNSLFIYGLGWKYKLHTHSRVY